MIKWLRFGDKLINGLDGCLGTVDSTEKWNEINEGRNSWIKELSSGIKGRNSGIKELSSGTKGRNSWIKVQKWKATMRIWGSSGMLEEDTNDPNPKNWFG